MSIVTGIPEKWMVDEGMAIASLKPGAEFAYNEDAGAITAWHSSGITQPTKSEIDAEVVRLKALWDDENYKRQRAAEYPSLVDQLDDIYHNGIDAWKATIKTTKDKYPKP